jgi:hypothetical protein
MHEIFLRRPLSSAQRAAETCDPTMESAQAAFLVLVKVDAAARPAPELRRIPS